MTEDVLDHIGEVPDLVGLVCDEFICQGFVCDGEIVSTAGVTFVKCLGTWHRLVIDAPAVLWRDDEQPTTLVVPEEPTWSYPQVDLADLASVRGKRIVALRETATAGTGVTIEFAFDEGRAIQIVNIDARSDYAVI
jgi:hypothetical protein